jgi:predicted amidohydrolase
MATLRTRSWRRPAPGTIAAVAAAFPRDLELGLERIERTVVRLRERGARLIVFPEAALGGYLYAPRPGDRVAYTPQPPALQRDSDVFARLIRAAGPAVVCLGYTEDAPGGPFSSAVCLSGDGGILGHHRKVHIPPSERGVIAPGDGFAAFDTPIGRMGVLLCYDKVFPEAARGLAVDGAETIVCPAAWPVCRRAPARLTRNDRQVRHFNAIDVTRAIENQVVWVAANHYGPFGRVRFPGQSKVVDPEGRVLATTGNRAGVAVARIDPTQCVRHSRRELSHLGDRLPHAYALDGLASLT